MTGGYAKIIVQRIRAGGRHDGPGAVRHSLARREDVVVRLGRA